MACTCMLSHVESLRIEVCSVLPVDAFLKLVISDGSLAGQPLHKGLARQTRSELMSDTRVYLTIKYVTM